MLSLRHVAITVLGLLVFAPATSQALDIVPYESTGWSYQQVNHNDPLEATFMLPGFDDHLWAVGQSPFGYASCGWFTPVHTSWSLNTDVLLRRLFGADPASPVTIHFAIDNDAAVWVNGVLIASVVHEGCQQVDEWNFAVPAVALQIGANVLAIKAVDRGGASFFDLRLAGEQPVPTLNTSWGKLKSFYR